MQVLMLLLLAHLRYLCVSGGGGGYGGRGRGDYGGRDQEATNGFRGGYAQGYGGRGGRGGGRGTNINVDDQSAFPTLG